MSQTIILENLAWFLKSNPATAHDREIVDLAQFLTDEGFCYSFALCHAVYDEWLDQLDWWEEALLAIANCPHDILALDRKVTLPLQGNTQDLSLRQIFERVLNDIIFQRGTNQSGLKPFTIEGVNQNNFFKNYFDLLHNGIVKKIQHHEKVAGYFIESELDQLITTLGLEHRICLIVSPNHCIRVGYRQKQWILYDSNDAHTSRKTMHQIFTAKNELIKTIITILGSTLSITVASLDLNQDNPLNAYHAILNQNVLSVMKGWDHILFQTPLWFPTILTELEKQSEGSHFIASILPAIAWDNTTGFEHVIMNAPGQVKQVLNLIKNNSYGVECLLKALCLVDKNNVTGLEILAREIPLLLKKVLREASKGEDGVNKIAEALCVLQETGFSALYMIAIQDPNQLLSVLNSLRADASHSKQIEATLHVPYEGQCIWSFIQDYEPDILVPLYALLNQVQDGAAKTYLASQSIFRKQADQVTHEAEGHNLWLKDFKG
ncbi:MAG: hypothetical protein H0W64_09030 [Gammaproteobacteria bacterium]|nr:hypothetical protein [Gammaproteobacteria bacterium]